MEEVFQQTGRKQDPLYIRARAGGKHEATMQEVAA